MPRVRWLALLLVILPASASADDKPPPSGPWTPIAIALWDPVGIIGSNEDITGVSFNILYGSSHSMFGIEAGLVNHTEQLVGLQLGFLGNSDGDAPFGLQVGGFYNGVDNGRGLQLSGLGNAADKSYVGLQLATMANIVAGPADALELSLWNNVQGDFHGLQIGMINMDGQTLPIPIGPEMCSGGNCTQQMQVTSYPDRRATGALLGLWNKSQNFTGLSVGLANVVESDAGGIMLGVIANATGDFAGGQIGLVNVAHDMTGVQIGLVNFAHRMRGLQLGGFNVATDNGLPFMVGLNAGL